MFMLLEQQMRLGYRMVRDATKRITPFPLYNEKPAFSCAIKMFDLIRYTRCSSPPFAEVCIL
jgi:hypothetical protein